MTTPPPRKRFQIHLSTAIVMMFVAGGLIWANMHARRRPTLSRVYVEHLTAAFVPEETGAKMIRDTNGTYWISDTGFHYGWPANACIQLEHVTAARHPQGKEIKEFGPDTDRNLWISEEAKDWFPGAIILDAVVALIILFATWFLCEWLIRRRAARKGA